MKIVERFYKHAQVKTPVDEEILRLAIDEFWRMLTDEEEKEMIEVWWSTIEDSVTESFYNIAEEGEEAFKDTAYPRIYELYEKYKRERGLELPVLEYR